jgi:hypothetical protein
MTPRAFLDILWQYKPEEMYLLIWTGQDKRSHWFQDSTTAAAFVASDACRGKCVFVGLGASKTDNGPAHRCTSDEITALCAVWTDLDLKGEAHKGKALPGTIDDALSVLPKDMPPTITVSTGNGAHAWWVFKEPLTFDTGEDRSHAVGVLNRWHTMIRLRCAARGWAYDRLSDLARVARVSGTLNMKDAANPKPVTVIASTDRRYDLSDFEEYVDDAGIPGTVAQERAAREWAERFKDKGLVINPAARIPQQILDAWMDAENSDKQTAARFRNTWERRRHDLKDPSQSGYDLALADFGVLAGVPEQRIVDMICHHRAIHGQKQRTREDYFQRTIARAMERNPEAPAPAIDAATPPPTTGLAAPQGAHVAPEGQEAADTTTSKPPAAPAPPPAKDMSPEDHKAMLCEKISTGIGIPIPITRLVRITGKDPSFRMELADDTKIEFTSISKFRNQEAVRDALAAQMKWLMPQIKPTRWREIAQDMLHACFDEEGPIEAKWEESARDAVGRYLEDNGFIEDIAAAPPQYRGKPIIKDGRIAINTTDFHGWINRTTFQNMSVKALASQLAAMGAEQRRVTGKHREQSRWLLPIEHFSPADYQQKGTAVVQEPQEGVHVQ